MSESPKRKKRLTKRPARTRRKQPPRGDRPPSLPRELDLRTLVVLSVGEWWELADHEWPPERICRWLDEADPRQLRGLLLATLERWHELREH